MKLRLDSRRRFPDIWMAVLSIIPVMIFSWWFLRNAGGLPEDDAYIFLRYARNFIENGKFEYNPGQSSIGFTSALWLLAIAFSSWFTGLSVLISVKLLAVIFMGCMAVLMFYATRNLTGSTLCGSLGSILFVLCPMILEQSISGMEVPMLITGLLVVICMESARVVVPMLLKGLLMGLLVWIRPECLLVFPAWLIFHWLKWLYARWSPDVAGEPAGKLSLASIHVAAGFCLLVIPYLIICQLLSEDWIPQTFIGKVLTHQPNWFQLSGFERFVKGLRLFLRSWANLIPRPGTGSAVLTVLLASIIWPIPVLLCMRRNEFPVLVFPLLICAMIVPAYWYCCPVANLRYGIWLIPVSMMIILSAFSEIYRALVKSVLPGRSLESRIVMKCMTGAILLMVVISWASGLKERFINYQVTASSEFWDTVIPWLDQSIPTHESVALDMVGQLGYRLDHPIFDLGGLINPEIWPALKANRNADMAMNILVKNDVRYVVLYSRHILWSHLITQSHNRLVLIDKRGSPESHGVMMLCRVLPGPLLNQEKLPLTQAQEKPVPVLLSSTD